MSFLSHPGVSKCVKCVCNIWTSSFSFPVPSGVQLGDGQLQAAVRGPPVSRQLRQLLDQLCGAQTAGTHPARPPLSLERCWRCWVEEGVGERQGAMESWVTHTHTLQKMLKITGSSLSLFIVLRSTFRPCFGESSRHSQRASLIKNQPRCYRCPPAVLYCEH